LIFGGAAHQDRGWEELLSYGDRVIDLSDIAALGNSAALTPQVKL